MTFVIIGGGIDLSVGAIMALASRLGHDAGHPGVRAGRSWSSARSLVGTGAGLVNGLLIAYGRLVPFIATLAMLVAARGLAQRMSDRKTQIIQPDNARSSTCRPRGCSASRCWSTSSRWSWSLGWVLLNRTTFGRRTYAVGGNPEAARLAGINVRRHTMLLYALSGLCCGIAAIMIMARTTTGSSTHGDLYELDAIAAVDHRRHPAHRRPRHDHRLDPRPADLHPDHEPVHPQRPRHQRPADRQGPDHRRRRPAPAGRKPRRT